MPNKYHSDLLIDSIDIHPRLFNRLNHWSNPPTQYVVGLTGTGTAAAAGSVFAMNTGATANSTAFARWNPAGDIDAAYSLNAAKTHLFKVGLCHISNDAEYVAWLHFRTTAGVVKDLDESGFGIKFSNYTVEGESYGASGRTTIALGTAENSKMKYFWIKFTPGVSIQFWFGTDPFLNPPTAIITDPTLIPASGLSTYNIAHKNGASGNVNSLLITQLHVWVWA